LGIDDIGFSLDALYEDTFREITGGDLQPIEDAVIQFAETRKQLRKRKPKLRVLLVEQQANVNEIDAYINRWIPVVDDVVIQARRTHAGRVLETPRTESRKPCRHLFDTVFIQWDGKMVVCCEDWQSVTCVGNAFERPLSGLWRSDLMVGYRKAQMSGIFQPPEICKDCQAWAGGRQHVVKHNAATEYVTSLTRVWRRKDIG
jgi:radical SAM protein with 4Fe4S-binding SPASM domain